MDELAKWLLDDEQAARVLAKDLKATKFNSMNRISPYSVSQAPLAADQPNCRTKKIPHVIVFVLILVVWYFPLLSSTDIMEVIDFMFHLHALSIVDVFDSRYQLSTLDRTLYGFGIVESMFGGLLCVVLMSRSLILKIVLLVVAVCWSVWNLYLTIAMNSI